MRYLRFDDCGIPGFDFDGKGFRGNGVTHPPTFDISTPQMSDFVVWFLWRLQDGRFRERLRTPNRLQTFGQCSRCVIAARSMLSSREKWYCVDLTNSLT